MHWLQCKTPALGKVLFLKKIKNNRKKKRNFWRMVILGNDFHFLGYNGFLQFFRPLVEGVNHPFFFFFRKNIFSFLWHKAYKIIQTANISLILREMWQKGPPLPKTLHFFFTICLLHGFDAEWTRFQITNSQSVSLTIKASEISSYCR